MPGPPTPLRRLVRGARIHGSSVATIVAWCTVVVFALGATGSALLGRSTFAATDLLTTVAPWAGSGGEAVGNPWPADTIDVVTPKLVLLKDALLSGTVPWWNPYVAGGAPFAALPDTGLGNPLAWPWLVLPDSYAPGVVKLLEIAVAVAGMALLLRRLGLSRSAQAVGALAFVSSGFMIAWTGWPQTRVAALVPLLFWAADRAVRLRRARDCVPFALVLAAMLLGGFPAIVGYAAYALVPYAVARLWEERAPLREWVRASAVCAGGALLGAGLAAVQLVPFAANAVTTINFERRAQDAGMHLDWSALATALVPDALGEVSDPLWGASNPVERFSYAGAAVLVLCALTLVVRTRRPVSASVLGYVAAGVGVCAALVYGGVLLGSVQDLPVFGTSFIGRLRVVLGFFLAICAAFGFHALERFRGARTPEDVSQDDALDKEETRARRGGRALRIALLLLLVLGGALVVRAALLLAPHEALPQVRSEVVVAVALLVAGAGAAVAARWLPGPTARTAALVVLPVLVAAQTLTVVGSWWPRSEVETFYPRTATHDFLDANLGSDRYAATGLTMMPGTGSLYQQRSATGHAFHTDEWLALLVSADPDAMRSPTYSVLHPSAAGSPVLDRMAVAYLVDDPAAWLPGDLDASSPMTGTTDLEPGTSILSAPVADGLRGVRVDLAAGIDLGSRSGSTLVVSVLDASGDVLTRTGTDVTATSDPTSLWVALAVEDRPASEQVRIQLELEDGRLAALPVDADGQWVANVVRADDGLTVVHAGDATVYARAGALDRIRWSSDAVVVTDSTQRVDLLASGTLAPGTTVLSTAGDLPDLDPGASADVEVSQDGYQRIAASVDATGAGLLVVADSRRPGWSARLDGEPVALVEADHAMSAVAVPAGTHVVELVYETPGLRAGAAVTALALTAVVALVVPAWNDGRRRRQDVRVTDQVEPEPGDPR